jgi:hypothetical protein
LLSNPSRTIEFAAIKCISRLLKNHAKSIAGSLLHPILDRFDQFPAREYVAALSDIFPICTHATFEGVIIPLVYRFIGRGGGYDWAIGELLVTHQFAVISPSPDLFARFLTSTVIVNHYLPALVQLAVEAGGVAEDWCCRVYPSAIVHTGGTNPSARVGVVEALAYLSDVIHPSHMLGYLVMAFDWCEGNAEVGLALAAKADEVLNSRTVGLAARFTSLMTRLLQSRDPAVIARLPRILGNNPAVFLSDDAEGAEFVEVFAESADPEVVIAFLDNFSILFARASGHTTQEVLLRAFRKQFENPSPAVTNRLAIAQTYAFFGPAKLLQLVPLLVAFAPCVRSWRDAVQLAHTFLSFPPEVLRPHWLAIADAIIRLFVRHAHALGPQFQPFCGRFAGLLEGDARHLFVDQTIGTLARAGWSARRLIAPLTVTVAPLLHTTDSVILHAALRARLLDRVPAVVLGVMAPLGKLRQFWALKGEDELEREVVAMFTGSKAERERLIGDGWMETWKETWEMPAPRGIVSALPKLPVGAKREDRARKGIVNSPLKSKGSFQGSARRQGSVLSLTAAGQPRRRIFQVSDMRGESLAASSYSGPGLAGPRLSETGLSVLGGPGLLGSGLRGGMKRV